MKKMIIKFVEKLTRGYFERLVYTAYKECNGKSHVKIKKASEKSYNISNVNIINRKFCNLYVRLVFLAQCRLFEKKVYIDLGAVDIGVGNLKIYGSTQDHNSSVVYLTGISSKTTFDVYEKYSQKNSIAIDVGANLGMHSLVLSKCVGKLGEVYSYEPVPDIYERLTKNIALNQINNINPINCGVSNLMGELSFDSNDGDFNIGMARINKHGNSKIKVITIDDGLGDSVKPVSIIKIDVEGHELNVIKGAKKVLEKFKPVILMEFNPDYYTLSELIENIPFEAKYFILPTSYVHREQEIKDHNITTQVDIIIKPI